MPGDTKVVLENGEFYVAGIRAEYKRKDTCLINGVEVKVIRERDDDYYVSGVLVRGAMRKPLRRYPAYYLSGNPVYE